MLFVVSLNYSKVSKVICKVCPSFFTIFIDDIKIIHNNKEILILQTKFCKACLKASGWTINSKKSELIPSQQIMYLGFYSDTMNFKYFSHVKKLNIIIEMIDKILEHHIVTKLELASLLGKIASHKRSNDNVVHIISRIISNTFLFFHLTQKKN